MVMDTCSLLSLSLPAAIVIAAGIAGVVGLVYIWYLAERDRNQS